jgi:pimeloyl-ACP methyl ester carboxylesterase
MAAEVRDVLAVADAVAGPLLLVVGHSSGAVVALQSALAAPSRFAGLVRARAALDSGEPGRAIAIHLREIVGMPRLAVAAMRLVPPIWQLLRGYAARPDHRRRGHRVARRRPGPLRRPGPARPAAGR